MSAREVPISDKDYREYFWRGAPLPIKMKRGERLAYFKTYKLRRREPHKMVAVLITRSE